MRFLALLMCTPFAFCGPIVAQKAESANVPLCPGLTVVTAVHQENGDYESIKTVTAADNKEVQLKYSAELMDSGPMGLEKPKLRHALIQRNVLLSDLESAAAYQQVYMEQSDATIPGTTSIGISRAVFRALATKGEVELSYSNAYGGLQLSSDRSKSPNYYSYLQLVKLHKTSEIVRIPVLLNDQPVDLPALRAEGESYGTKMEFDFLDDENNPLTLAFRIGIGGIKPLTPEQAELCKNIKGSGINALLGGGRCDMPNGGDSDTLHVIKISTRCTGPATQLAGSGPPPSGAGLGGDRATGANALDRALSQTGKVDVYSIYFSFNSDVIREESQPSLKDIAEVMRRHPDWKLSVDGHTDNIGGNDYNLALSKRRSAAVKDYLVKQFGISAARLVTGGHGASQPKDTNDTLEGRARNRRVELVRIG